MLGTKDEAHRALAARQRWVIFTQDADFLRLHSECKGLKGRSATIVDPSNPDNQTLAIEPCPGVDKVRYIHVRGLRLGGVEEGDGIGVQRNHYDGVEASDAVGQIRCAQQSDGQPASV